MKTTENSLLKASQKQTTIATADRNIGVKSARPMKSMVRVKSIRPQKIELKGRMRRRIVKL